MALPEPELANMRVPEQECRTEISRVQSVICAEMTLQADRYPVTLS
jgi:hypothetical protein